jgi:hypothetical protein
MMTSQQSTTPPARDRLTAAIHSRGLEPSQVKLPDAISFVEDIEAEYAQVLTEADWDQVINSYSVSGLVIC